MGNIGNDNHNFFHLTDLQIRDLRYDLSCQTLFLSPDNKKFYILVHKHPGLINPELHQNLFVFEVSWSNVRGINYVNQLQTDTSVALEAKLVRRWEFDSIEQASNCISSWYSGTDHGHHLQEYLYGVSNKGDVFHDACENFPSSKSVSNDDEFHEDCSDFSGNSVCPGMEHTTSLPWPPPPDSGPYKRRKIMKSSFPDDEVCEEEYSERVGLLTLSVSSSSSPNLESENTRLVSEATSYNDVLILFGFDDHDLPFKLKEIIMSDLRLLTLLEYGLPSWVIFLQSHPVFCQFYRPWMCPLAIYLYMLFSITTLLIGFYDICKNVPILKKTVTRLFGRLFDWIETWEMISRIRYLGTMLFLHNFEKAVIWFLVITQGTRSLFSRLVTRFGPFFDWIENWEMISRIRYLGTMLFLHNIEKAVKWLLVITQDARSLFSCLVTRIAVPTMELVEVILPLWAQWLELAEDLFSVLLIVLGSSYNKVESTLQLVIWPFRNLQLETVGEVFSVLWTVLGSSYSIVGSTLQLIIRPFWNLYLKTVEERFSVLWIVLGSSKSIVKGTLQLLVWLFRLVFGIIWSKTKLVIYRIVWLFSNAYYFLNESWSSISVLLQLASTTEASIGIYEFLMRRSLWNELFCQVFSALRSSLYGSVDFFAICNRPRLSIYNHIRGLLLCLSHVTRSSNISDCHHEFQRQKTQNPSECGRSPDKFVTTPLML